jgi:hypothetical protein
MATGLDTRTTTTHETAATGARDGSARTMTVIGFLFAALALFAIVPPVTGGAAIALGIVARNKGDHLGTWAAVAGVVGLVGGIAIAMWIVPAMLNSNI